MLIIEKPGLYRHKERETRCSCSSSGSKKTSMSTWVGFHPNTDLKKWSAELKGIQVPFHHDLTLPSCQSSVVDDGLQPQVTHKGFEPQEFQMTSLRSYTCGWLESLPVWSVLGFEQRALYMLSKHSVLELHPQVKDLLTPNHTEVSHSPVPGLCFSTILPIHDMTVTPSRS